MTTRLAPDPPEVLPRCLHHDAPQSAMEPDEVAPAGWRVLHYGCGCRWRWDRQVGAYDFFRVWP